jgi:hypothetical protein
MTENIEKRIKSISIIVFGIIVPMFVLFQAYSGISTLTNNVIYDDKIEDVVANYKEINEIPMDGNDFSLFSLVYTEHANQKMMVNKQVMKVSIIQIGFAVISIGMMLIVLGINDGGADSSAGFGGVSFDIKTGSSGVFVFVVGAIMATAGGVLKNDYNTVPIPAYYYQTETIEHTKTLTAYRECMKLGPVVFDLCFKTAFEEINRGEI